MTSTEKTVNECIDRIERAGGRLWLVDGDVKLNLPENFRPMVDVIRKYKQEFIVALRQRANRPVELTAKEWDELLHTWTQERCAWRERSYGATSGLYVSFCVWCAASDKPLPVTLV